MQKCISDASNTPLRIVITSNSGYFHKINVNFDGCNSKLYDLNRHLTFDLTKIIDIERVMKGGDAH